MTGTASGSSRDRGLRASLALASVLTLLGSAVASGAVVAGAGPAVADDVGNPAVTVSAMDPLEFRPDQPVVIRGTTSAGRQPVDGRVVVRRTSDRLDTRSALDQWEEAADRGAGVEVASVPTGTVPPGESRPFEVTVPPGGLGLSSSLSAAGAYGLTVELADAAGQPVASQRGFAVWSPDLGIEPTTVVPVLRLPTLPPDLDTGFADPAELEAATAAGGQLRGALDVATRLPGAWALDPMLAASAARTGAGASSRDWLTDLARERRARELLVQPWAVPDADLLGASGRGNQLLTLADGVASHPFAANDTTDADDPTDADDTTDADTTDADDPTSTGPSGPPSTGVPATEPSTAPAPAAPTTAPPTTEALEPGASAPDTGRVVNYRMAAGPAAPGVRGDLALVDDGAGADGLAALASTGRAVVVPDTVVPLADESLSYTPDGRAQLDTSGGPLAVLVDDTALGRRLSTSLAGDPLDATAVLADLAAITLQRPSDPRLVGAVVDGLAGGGGPAADAVATALQETPWADVGDVTGWIETTAPDIERRLPPATTDVDRAPVVAAVDELFDALAFVESLEAAADDGPGRTDRHERQAAAAVAGDLTVVRELTQQFQLSAAGLEQGVRIVPGSSITLAADEASIPVTVVNELDDDVSLTLQARSRSPRVRVTESQVPVVVEAGERVRVDVPVRAVSNGPATLTLQLAAPDSTSWGPTVDTDVRVATVADAGALAVVAAVTAGLFVFGAYRAIRRGRQRRARMTA